MGGGAVVGLDGDRHDTAGSAGIAGVAVGDDVDPDALELGGRSGPEPIAHEIVRAVTVRAPDLGVGQRIRANGGSVRSGIDRPRGWRPGADGDRDHDDDDEHDQAEDAPSNEGSAGQASQAPQTEERVATAGAGCDVPAGINGSTSRLLSHPHERNGRVVPVSCRSRPGCHPGRIRRRVRSDHPDRGTDGARPAHPRPDRPRDHRLRPWSPVRPVPHDPVLQGRRRRVQPDRHHPRHGGPHLAPACSDRPPATGASRLPDGAGAVGDAGPLDHGRGPLRTGSDPCLRACGDVLAARVRSGHDRRPAGRLRSALRPPDAVDLLRNGRPDDACRHPRHLEHRSPRRPGCEHDQCRPRGTPRSAPWADVPCSESERSGADRPGRPEHPGPLRRAGDRVSRTAPRPDPRGPARLDQLLRPPPIRRLAADRGDHCRRVCRHPVDLARVASPAGVRQQPLRPVHRLHPGSAVGRCDRLCRRRHLVDRAGLAVRGRRRRCSRSDPSSASARRASRR